MDLAAPIVKDQLIAPLDDDAPFELTADGVMDVIYRWDIDDGLDVADHVETVLRLPRFSGRVWLVDHATAPTGVWRFSDSMGDRYPMDECRRWGL